MQKRHSDRLRYFLELAATTKEYFLPYIRQFHNIDANSEILEIGCGEGGNLLCFSKMGCNVTGIDISANRIRQAAEFFALERYTGTFINSDVFNYQSSKRFDVILCHDVFEHVFQKSMLLHFCAEHLKPKGVVFLAFPPWRMPFGGHQQICRNRVLANLPYIHILPTFAYKGLLKMGRETDDCINELLCIRNTSITINRFYRLIKQSDLDIADNEFWFINPHYKQKFGFRPLKLYNVISKIPYLRDYVTTSFICILRPKH